MPIAALGLILASGAIHAFWNMLLKKSQNKIAFTWLSILASLLIYAPLFLFSVYQGGLNNFQWKWPLLSGVFQGFYFFLLAKAYEYEDMSVVYPLSRGAAPLFTAILAPIFLKEGISLRGELGIALIVVGVWILHLKGMSINSFRQLISISFIRTKGSLLALAVALAIAFYHLIDKRGLTTNHPFTHLYLLSFIMLGCFMTLMVFQGRGDSGDSGDSKIAPTREWAKYKWEIIAVGFLYFFSYLLVLFAMSISKVSYIVAARSLNLIFGSLIGWKLLNESYGKNRVLGASIITAGMVIMALA